MYIQFEINGDFQKIEENGSKIFFFELFFERFWESLFLLKKLENRSGMKNTIT